MKKLILILSILIGLNSCTRIPSISLKITDIEDLGKGYCKYTNFNDVLLPMKSHIIDTCGKYNIGDIITFKKQ